ncbi:MAG: SIR2 family protein [Alphaproteobacteria bacterium]
MQDSALKQRLEENVNGGGLLFCGSGFSSDCLNFDAEELGTSEPLLTHLNGVLKYDCRDLSEAASIYWQEHGSNALMNLLKEKYKAAQYSIEVQNILKYSWFKIYTTNYDNVISRALSDLPKKHEVINNSDGDKKLLKLSSKILPIIHLHGAVDRWDDLIAFEKSCILSHESYVKITSDFKWGETLREDLARAKFVVFIGFSNSDLHLASSINSVAHLRNKAYFINSPNSGNDRGLLIKQGRYGEILNIGLAGFSPMINQALTKARPNNITLCNFKWYETLPEASETEATVQQQETLLHLGKVDASCYYRDILNESMSYRVKRSVTQDIMDALLSADKGSDEGSVVMITGGICSGKTLLLEECMFRLMMAGHKVLRLVGKYNNLAEEIALIARNYENIYIAIDDCFAISTYLRDLIKLSEGKNIKFILASRRLALDAEPGIEALLSIVFDINMLSENEAVAMEQYIERVGGKKLPDSLRKTNLSMAGVLLQHFKSDLVRNRFKAELDRFKASSPKSIRLLIIAFHLKYVGATASETVMSELLEADAVDILEKVESYQEFISYDSEINHFHVLQGVYAQHVLQGMFKPDEIIETISDAVLHIAKGNLKRKPAYQHIFKQFMRYTQLQGVVTDSKSQNSFFDRLSRSPSCRNHILFWLQWSMAMKDQADYIKARIYLDKAYEKASRLHQYNTHQLDDQSAQLFLAATPETANSRELYHDFENAYKALHTSNMATSFNNLRHRTINAFSTFIIEWQNEIKLPEAKKIQVKLHDLLKLMRNYRAQIKADFYLKQTDQVISELENAINICAQISDD